MAAVNFTPKQHSNDVHVKADRDGLKVGLTKGLNLTHCLNELFIANGAGLHWSDEEMLAWLQAEYPKRGGKFQSLTAYRGYFNAGLHGHGYPPGERVSDKYRAKGKRAPKADKPAKSEGKAKGGKADAKPAKGKPVAKGKPAPKAKAKS